MFLLSVTKKGFSTKEIQKQLGLKRYEPVWAMVHKLRRAMGTRDSKYTLEGMIEFDEGYFTVESSEVEKSKGKRGRGAAGKQNVAISAESIPLEDIETGKKSKHCRYFKAKLFVYNGCLCLLVHCCHSRSRKDNAKRRLNINAYILWI